MHSKATPISEILVPAPAGWRALLNDVGNGGSYSAPIVAWTLGNQGDSLIPVCATADPPGYPRIPTERELVAVYAPGDDIGLGDYEMAADQEKLEQELEDREYARKRNAAAERGAA